MHQQEQVQKVMAWIVQTSVRNKPFGKVMERCYDFEMQPTAADLKTKALGMQAVDQFDVYDAALLLTPTTLLTSDMCLMVCPKRDQP